MMELVRVALRRPYTVAVLSLLVLLLGGLAVTRMVVDFFPKIDIPVVFVGWNYPGLSAEEMERRVIIISERAYSTTVNGIERIESRWMGKGEPGDRYRAPNHVYADDLDVFGRGSLFELLCTARTQNGEATLAEWLQAPSPAAMTTRKADSISTMVWRTSPPPTC